MSPPHRPGTRGHPRSPTGPVARPEPVCPTGRAGPARTRLPHGRGDDLPVSSWLFAQFPAPLAGSGVPPGLRCRVPRRRGCSRSSPRPCGVRGAPGGALPSHGLVPPERAVPRAHSTPLSGPWPHSSRRRGPARRGRCGSVPAGTVQTPGHPCGRSRTHSSEEILPWRPRPHPPKVHRQGREELRDKQRRRRTRQCRPGGSPDSAGARGTARTAPTKPYDGKTPPGAPRTPQGRGELRDQPRRDRQRATRSERQPGHHPRMGGGRR